MADSTEAMPADREPSLRDRMIQAEKQVYSLHEELEQIQRQVRALLREVGIDA